MGKVTLPLMSAEVRGSFGKAITFTKRYGTNIVKLKIQKNGSNTLLQQNSRQLVKDAAIAWSSNATVGAVTINSGYKEGFATAAAGKGYSGYSLFIKKVVALNDGSAYDGSLVIPASATA